MEPAASSNGAAAAERELPEDAEQEQAFDPDPRGVVATLLGRPGTPGAGTSEGDDDREALVTYRRNRLRERRNTFELLRAVAWVIAALIVLVLAPLIAAFDHARTAWPFGLYGLAFFAVGMLMRQQTRALTEEITELSNELDLMDLFEAEERRATKLLQVNQFDLKRYYDQTLRQGNQIFYVGVLCILLGFAVVGVAFWLVQGNQLSSSEDKIIVGALGAIGGVLANFIAVVYLRMFSATIESVGKFHQRLVVRDRLNFANILTAKIATVAVREAALSQMAVELAKEPEEGAPAAAPAAAATNGGAKADAPS